MVRQQQTWCPGSENHQCWGLGPRFGEKSENHSTQSQKVVSCLQKPSVLAQIWCQSDKSPKSDITLGQIGYQMLV
jgi:hypothetical protein